jgi:dihydrodipicolinate synthase/N-acetylneuraminate lyase
MINKPTGALSGIFTPNMVPLDSRGQINEDELARYVDWLIRNGVHGLYPNGSTGEFTRFTADERKRIVKIVCETANGRVPVLAGAAEANVKETLIACEKYAEYGARAVAIISPIFYKLGQESIYAYFKEIAHQSVIDVTVYNIPMLSSPIEVDTVCRLSEYERIIGIKDSSGDVGIMCRLISKIRPMRPAFTFMTGWEAVLVPMLAAGADGGTNASSGVVPEVTRKLFDLFKAGDLDGAMKIQYRLTELFDLMLYGSDFPDGFRAGVELRGLNMGSSRQPLSGKQTLDRKALKNMLECLIADFGVIDLPARCRINSAHAELSLMADSIAEEIVAALRQK